MYQVVHPCLWEGVPLFPSSPFFLFPGGPCPLSARISSYIYFPLVVLQGSWYKGLLVSIFVMSKVTVEISAHTHRSLRLLSVIQGQSITHLVGEAIERLIAENADQLPPIASQKL